MPDTIEKKILVIAQIEEGKTARITSEMLLTASELSRKTAGSVHAAVIGADIGQAVIELAKYANVLYSLENPSLKVFHSERYLQVLTNLCKQLHPDVILLAHNLDNIDLAPGLAFELRTTLITDCVELDMHPETGNLLCTKEVYGGNANAVFENNGKPAVATIRPKGLKEIDLIALNGKIEIIKPVIDESQINIQVIETIFNQVDALDKADVVVAGGRGMGGAGGVRQLEDLVQAFKESFEKVVVGGSRPAIDEGWLPGFRQIGLTGEKVNPQIYIAVGISGALQHMSGIFGSKKIVAINSNPEAAIFKYADYGVVGDFRDVLSSFTQNLRKAS
jgi:electron transfer flavoprotein alpha subunit